MAQNINLFSGAIRVAGAVSNSLNPEWMSVLSV